MSNLKARKAKTYRARKHLTQHRAENTCPTCGNGYNGSYCNNCGEKVFHPHDLSVPHLLEQTVDSFTHFDLKIPKSLLQVFNPGFLTYEFLHGIRVPFAKPVQLFIICNLIFFFCFKIARFNDYSPVLGDHHYFLISESYDIFKWAEPLDFTIIHGINTTALNKAKALQMIPDTTTLRYLYQEIDKNQENKTSFAQLFFDKSVIYSKTFIFLLIPLYALFFYLFLYKKFQYFGAALIFALHFACFNLLSFGFTQVLNQKAGINIFAPFNWLAEKLPVGLSSFFGFEGFELRHTILFVPYFMIAFRRLFNLTWYWNVPLAFLLSRIVYYINFGIYKKILIWLTLWLM